jgi:hypothetical protein
MQQSLRYEVISKEGHMCILRFNIVHVAVAPAACQLCAVTLQWWSFSSAPSGQLVFVHIGFRPITGHRDGYFRAAEGF